MKTVGIVAEYNPFTNGHAYHLKEAKRKTNAECAVAVMSGNFVQRGDAAVFDKWTRAKMAVESGVDLVIELPTAFSLSSAEGFARGAIYLLDKIGADFLAFGAETDSLDRLKAVADLLFEETDEFRDILLTYVKNGLSYPAARQKALLKQTEDASLLETPNNNLAVEYLKAIRHFNSKMQPVLIHRTGALHDSNTTFGAFASASHVREKLSRGEDVSSFVPSMQYFDNPVFTGDFEELLRYALVCATREEIAACPDADRALAARIFKYRNEPEITTCLHYIKTKRYTMSRVRRIFFHILLKNTIHGGKLPSYVRILAMNQTGAKLLASMRRDCPLELITRLSRAKCTNDEHLLLDIRAAGIYSTVKGERADIDYLKSPYVKK